MTGFSIDDKTQVKNHLKGMAEYFEMNDVPMHIARATINILFVETAAVMLESTDVEEYMDVIKTDIYNAIQRFEKAMVQDDV